MNFDKEKELARIKAKAARESANTESKALAIQTLPDAILEASNHIHAGIYKTVLASCSLEVETLADAIRLMETSNALVSMVLTKGTFTSFLEADNPCLTSDRSYAGATQTSINPWTLEVSYLREYGNTVTLQWFAEYGNHRFKFDCKIKQSHALPAIAVEWGESRFDGTRERYIKSARLVRLPEGCRSVKYANAQPAAVGNGIVYFPCSSKSAWQDFGIQEPAAPEIETVGGSR